MQQNEVVNWIRSTKDKLAYAAFCPPTACVCRLLPPDSSTCAAFFPIDSSTCAAFCPPTVPRVNPNVCCIGSFASQVYSSLQIACSIGGVETDGAVGNNGEQADAVRG